MTTGGSGSGRGGKSWDGMEELSPDELTTMDPFAVQDGHEEALDEDAMELFDDVDEEVEEASSESGRGPVMAGRERGVPGAAPGRFPMGRGPLSGRGMPPARPPLPGRMPGGPGPAVPGREMSRPGMPGARMPSREVGRGPLPGSRLPSREMPRVGDLGRGPARDGMRPPSRDLKPAMPGRVSGAGASGMEEAEAVADALEQPLQEQVGSSGVQEVVQAVPEAEVPDMLGDELDDASFFAAFEGGEDVVADEVAVAEVALGEDVDELFAAPEVESAAEVEPATGDLPALEDEALGDAGIEAAVELEVANEDGDDAFSELFAPPEEESGAALDAPVLGELSPPLMGDVAAPLAEQEAAESPDAVPAVEASGLEDAVEAAALAEGAEAAVAEAVVAEAVVEEAVVEAAEAPSASSEGQAREEVLAAEAPKPVAVPVVAERVVVAQRHVPQAPPAELAGPYLEDHMVYRAESRRLARMRQWGELATMTAAALDYATWAAFPEVRSALLLELARLYAEQLDDESAAEKTFLQLVGEDPTNREALAFLGELYRKGGNYRALHDLFVAAVEGTWDPSERISYIRDAVQIAREDLCQPDLVIQDWEHLWALGEKSEEVAVALTGAYREHRRWAPLATFLLETTASRPDGVRRVMSREVAEIYLAALREPEKALPIISTIHSERPHDPMALLGLVRIAFQSADYDRLAELSRLSDLPEPVCSDIRRVAADALWQGGERELAVDVYETLLERDPEDRDALRAKESYFLECGNFSALCAFLEARADRPDVDGVPTAQERLQLLERAARHAEEQLGEVERAIGLWMRIIELGGGSVDAFNKVIALYEMTGNVNGIANALEGLLALTYRPQARVEILARLGALYAHEINDDHKAEENWRGVLSLAPQHTVAQEELAEIYARRSDFECLDQTLTRQIAAAEGEDVLRLAHAKASNLEENIDVADRALAGWEVVLDHAPSDDTALQALARRAGEVSRERERIAAMEARVPNAAHEERIALGLAIAEAWSSLGAANAMVASYERVLRWDIRNKVALHALNQGCRAEEHGALFSAFELASNLMEDAEPRREMLREALMHLPSEDVRRRIAMLRRLVALGDEGALEQLRDEVEKDGRFEALAAVYVRLAGEAQEVAARKAALMDLARLYEEKLVDPKRAYLALSALGYHSEQHDEVIDELARLARETERWEDLLVVYDGLAGAHFPLVRRRAALLARIEILVKETKDYRRAMEDFRRLLALDPGDHETLRRAEALAQEHGLHYELLALYGELWDVAPDAEARVLIARKRFDLVSGPLAQPKEALTELLLQYRLSPDVSVRQALERSAGELDLWAVVLPRVEAEIRSAQPPEISDLLHLAQLYEDKLSDLDRSMELYAEVLVLGPDQVAVRANLARLAEASGQQRRYVQALRAAAAVADEATAVELYRLIATYYAETLEDVGRAVDVHRRLLRLVPRDRGALDALIQWHRGRSEWGDLRDVLRRRIAAAAPEEDVTALWIDVATLSRVELDDAEGALEAYARILATHPEHQEAREGVAALTADDLGPEVAVRRLRLELGLAAAEERPRLLLALARLQDHDLKQPEGAKETLRTLVEENGPCGPGFKPLSMLLERLGAWSELIALLEAHADEVGDEPVAARHFARALEICDQHVKDVGCAERLTRKLRALRPEDARLFDRLARTLRQSSRWEELVTVLEEALQQEQSPALVGAFSFELARIYDLVLQRPEEANKILKTLSQGRQPEPNAVLHMASLALRQANLDGYLAAREQHAKLLEPVWAALVHCHLAEVCDEKDRGAMVATHYRKARALDPDNAVAGEGLRALGRRLRNWRTMSALLPDDDERTLTWSQRAQRLCERARASADKRAAIDWLRRALAVDPDQVEGWRLLAATHAALGDTESQYEALLGALGAFERSVVPAPERLNEHARLQYEAGLAASACGKDERATTLHGRAYAMAPSFAPVALAVADIKESQGNVQAAFDIYHGVLEEKESQLEGTERDHAVFRRGALAARLGDTAQALDDLRATVRRDPLHAEALNALSRIHIEQGHPALGLANLQQALLVALERKQRGDVLYGMGRLWEDGLDDEPEAGLYYELALEHGADDPTLMKRALDHYKRDGRLDEALTMVDELTQNSDDPKTLATLWVTRGEILEERAPDEATEAFDMALSYEPGAGAALDGLERMLAKREEWLQLADLLEGRIDASESENERALALRRLADLCDVHLGDRDRTNETLRRLLQLEASPEVVDRLLANLQDAPIEERLELLESAVSYGTARYERAIELARFHLAEGRRLQAWAVLAPLRVVLHLEPDLKDILNDLRQEFDRAEVDMVKHLPSVVPIAERPRETLLEVLQQVRDSMGVLGVSSLEEVTSGAVEINESTPNGKLFHTMRQALGMEELQLWRSIDLPEPVVIVDGSPAIVCMRTEIFQKASGNELHFWLAMALLLAHPEVRSLAAMPEDSRRVFMPALVAALDLGVAPKGSEALVKRLRTELDEEELQGLRQKLQSCPEAIGEAKRFWTDSVAAAERAGALVVADLRSAWRAVGRIYESIPEQRNIKTIEELNAMFADSLVMTRLLRYYVGSEFSACM